jgi:mannose-1-phosphate guanylyltransferase
MTDRNAVTRTYAVIMAGGVGTRFWPRSREKSPKHLLHIVGKETMLQQTVKRLEPMVDSRNVFVVTNRLQKSQIAKQLSKVPEGNIIVEPVGRNTAPCIGLAALHIHRLDPDAVMVVLPADHLIQNEDEFRSVLKIAVETAANSDSLITIGMTPTHPETGYGYIQYMSDRTPDNPYYDAGVRKVKTFAEKPNLQTAEQFLASGDFLWNSGMFVWRAGAILKQIERTLPELWTELSKVVPEMGTSRYPAAVETAYGIIRGISIDYGVMEKADDVFVIPASFGWNDIGSWDEVYRVGGKDDRGNSITGKVIQVDVANSLIYSPEKLVAAVGVEDLIIVNTDDALLVCRRGRSQDVKEIVDYLKRKQMNDLL